VAIEEAGRCSCGAPLGTGTPGFRFLGLPPSVAAILEGHDYCGARCARAFILEALEFLDAASSTTAVLDLDEVRTALRVELVALALLPTASPPAS